MKKIIIAGGAGYIGSHMVYDLLLNNFELEVWDNFSNSTSKNLDKVKELLGKNFEVRNINLADEITEKVEDADAILHFAAFKAVGESVENPLKYYKNNILTTINLLDWAGKNNVSKFIFSSTAAVYSPAAKQPVSEESETFPESPYGQSKLFAEKIIHDFVKQNTKVKAAVLRYFNAAGNLDNGLLGDEAKRPSNLVPAIITSYLGINPSKFKIFGDDYETRDGTAVRDYIHVMDLVTAHRKTLDFLEKAEGFNLFNLGTGIGTTVKEIAKAFEIVTKEELDYEVIQRRPGDLPSAVADASKAKDLLEWEPSRGIEAMIDSSWRWYSTKIQSPKP